jgi:uncharacterized damage-inducible protein DinB
MYDPRYPIGTFEAPLVYDPVVRAGFIQQIAETPGRLRDAVAGLSETQLDHPYREGGWTVRQVVHHLPDSHMNSYLRFKLAVTEDQPTIKPYDEAQWARLPDAATADVEVSLSLLEALHSRWVLFLRGLGEAQFSRTFRHPELGTVSLDHSLALYAWHGRHHVAHVTALRDRMGWR